MPHRNPPDLFKFLEEVFSCRPNKREEVINKGTQPDLARKALKALAIIQRKEGGNQPGTPVNAEELRALETYNKTFNQKVELKLKTKKDPKCKEIPSSSPQQPGIIESFLNSIFCCPQERK